MMGRYIAPRKARAGAGRGYWEISIQQPPPAPDHLADGAAGDDRRDGGAADLQLMFGLTFATVLTLLIVPTMYTVFYRLKKPA